MYHKKSASYPGLLANLAARIKPRKMNTTCVSSYRKCPCAENICSKLRVENMAGPACLQCKEMDCWILIACRKQTSHVHAFPISGLCQHIAILVLERGCKPRERAAVEFCKSEPSETAFHSFVDRRGSVGPPCSGCGFLRSRKVPKLRVCGRCRDAAYCDRSCQKMDWLKHKQHCGKKLDPEIRTEQECECFTKEDQHLASAEALGHCSRPFCHQPLPSDSRLAVAMVRCKLEGEPKSHSIQLRHCSHACRKKHALVAKLTGSTSTEETLGRDAYQLAQAVSRSRGMELMEKEVQIWVF